jgi:hypothetical protein
VYACVREYIRMYVNACVCTVFLKKVSIIYITDTYDGSEGVFVEWRGDKAKGMKNTRL